VTVWVQPASLLYIGRLLKLPQARCILHPSCLKLTRGQANTLADVSPSFGCSIVTLLLLNNDIPNATAPLPAAAPICIIPDACLARAAEQPPASFRDEELVSQHTWGKVKYFSFHNLVGTSDFEYAIVVATIIIHVLV
jgi:hypothetical protein